MSWESGAVGAALAALGIVFLAALWATTWPRRTQAPASSGDWVRVWSGGPEYLEHLNGVDWINAPLPPPVHLCQPQTRARFGSAGELVERCACGAMRTGSLWLQRNSRGQRS